MQASSDLVSEAAGDWTATAAYLNGRICDEILTASLSVVGESWGDKSPQEVQVSLHQINNREMRLAILQGYLSRLADANIETNFEALKLSSFPYSERHTAMQMFMEHLIKKNPSSAAQLVLKEKDQGYHVEKIFKTWRLTAPAEAEKWLNGLPSHSRDLFLIKTVSSKDSDKLPAKEVIKLLQRNGIKPGTALVTEVVKHSPLKDKEKTLAWLNTIEDPYVRNSGINRLIVSQARKSKPEEVYQFVEQAPSAPMQERIMANWVHAQEKWNLKVILAATSQ